ncbi:DegT/DnrJ/EryC1/StrS family aminotransferase [Baia soyae]|uniref:dTDP-4-amino-4,6-dideoxygalactose transaminase n=1 Tax=Baia soyae TaxID=1544746 RepID=A0A4R2S0X3_9BACL|nr:DegT/DnrJ/EryC1/StrS family aminotransferase [Baia soyae]TCP65931.1 dTDP-4-amino-4,6-dideoxygalactose transaminase [Baia soyae]
MKKIPLLDLKAQFATIREEVLAAVENVFESGAYILGPEVKALEKEVAEYIGVKHAIGVANGTDALVLTLDAMGVGPGDEVITTPFTFFASAETVSQVRGTPVFVDVDPETYNLDIEQLKAKITDKTKVIIPVHIFGQPANMDELRAIAEEKGIYILEDAAQAMGSQFQGQMIGSWGDAATYSFFPTKNLGGYGDGGMVVTNNDELAQKIRILRVHGSSPKYYHSMIGYNSRLDEIQATALRIKLRHLDQWNDARREKATIYNELLKDTPLVTPYEAPDRKHIYHLYIVQAEQRDELMKYLGEHGISTGVYYPVPLHLQEVYKDLGQGEGSMPVSEYLSKRTFALPLYPELSHEDMNYIVDTIKKFYK